MRMQNSGKLLWVEWALATFIGYTIGILSVLPWAVQLAYAAQPALIIGLAGGAVLGGAVGGAQWLILRRHMQQVDIWWVFASVAGGMLGLGAGMALADTLVLPMNTGLERGSPTPIFPLHVAIQTGVTGAVVGVVLGSVQWLVLRRFLRTAGLWIIASGVGWMAGMGLGAVLVEVVSVVGASLITGVTGGVITGLALQHWLWPEMQSGLAGSKS